MRASMVLAGLVVVVGLLVGGGWLLILLEEPEPPQALFEDEPTLDLAAYDGTQPADAGDPSVLVLGSIHFAQQDHGYGRDDFAAVVATLADYQPDLIAVEYLPPDWPPGEGRDYRPDVDRDALAERWDLDPAEAEAIRADAAAHDDPCEVGRAHFLLRDEPNAGLWWDRHDCADPIRAGGELADWWAHRLADEDALLAHPVADEVGIDRLISIDYQGDDAAWFIHEELLSLDALTSPGQVWQLLPEVSPTARQFTAHISERDDTLTGLLHTLNSPEWIGLQYWNYEQVLAGIELGDDAGRRQLEHFWRRNEAMFERLDDAVAEHEPERVLVVTGAGHKYFLDELARDAGYRWVDPRDHLP